MEYPPPKDENLIDTEVGTQIAPGTLDFETKLKEAEAIVDPAEKINALLQLSIEAKRHGKNDFSRDLNQRAIELDNEHDTLFEKETKYKVTKLSDEIARFKYNPNKGEGEVSEEIEQTQFPVENFEEMEIKKEEPVVVDKKKSLGKRLASALNNFFSF